jgi:hypothetical protein
MSFATEVTSAAGGLGKFATPDGVDHQTVLLAEADGHIIGSRPDYWAYFTEAAHNTSTPLREIAEIFNASASSILRIRGIWIIPTQATIATAVSAMKYDLNRISTVGNGATTITPRPFDTTFPAMPSGVTLRTNSTTGAALVYTYTPNFHYLDEISTGVQMLPYMNLLPVLGDRCIEIVLRPSQGFSIRQALSTTTGSVGALLYFVVDN